MNKSRFFAFGCSYTKWGHPTWADFIGINYEEYYNFGKPGACNTYIMNKLIEANELHKLNSETDFVMVSMTGFGRFTYLESPKVFGWEGNYEDELQWEYNWQTTGDILPPADNHPKVAKLIGNNVFNYAWAAYNSWIAFKIIKEFLTLKGIEHKIISALDTSHYVEEVDTLQLHHKFPNIGYISPKLKEMYKMLDCDISIEKYKRNNLDIYLEDTTSAHPSKEVHYDYTLKYFPHLITEKSKKLLMESVNIIY